MSRQTGLDSAPLIPIGAVVSRTSWNVANTYSVGEEFDTKDLALEHAIKEKRAAVTRHGIAHQSRYPGQPVVPLPERITLDYRWYLSYPGGGGLDLPVQRIEYDNIAEAEEALRLYRKFSPNGVTQ